MNISDKPRLVYFQYKYDSKLPPFIILHAETHVKCLEQFFQVTVVNYDADFAEICDKFEPEIVLFEAGINHLSCRRPKITNLGVNPAVIRAAIHNADSWCDARAGFVADMDEIGVDTYFSICVSAGENNPPLADRYFSWPNAVDADVFKDYGEHKLIPLLFTGNVTALYPWRSKAQRILGRKFPSLICPHLGYEPNRAKMLLLFGERYARTINGSYAVPTCGTVVRELVRKHLEIPAARSCLVTEPSPALDAAGFVDMENCVLSEGDDVLEKVDFLFDNPDKLESITNAGYDLVHARHTLQHRDQIYQWFCLRKALAPGQRIIQHGAFGGFSVVDHQSPQHSNHIKCGGPQQSLLRAGDGLLLDGETGKALENYIRCANYLEWMPEPKLRIARARLYEGNAAEALKICEKLNNYVLEQYKACRPDPLEWSMYLLAQICSGDLRAALKLDAKFPQLRHETLERMRWVMSQLSKSETPAADENDRREVSIHSFPGQNFDSWKMGIIKVLKACGETEAASNLERAPAPPKQWWNDKLYTDEEACEAAEETQATNSTTGAKRTGAGKAPPLPADTRRGAKAWARRTVIALERRFGFFLPYRYSSIRQLDTARVLESLAVEHSLHRCILIGAEPGSIYTEAFLAGFRRISGSAFVHCLSTGESKIGKLRRLSQPKLSITGSSFAELSNEQIVAGTAEAKQVMGSSEIDALCFDTSAVAKTGIALTEFARQLLPARLVILGHLNTESGSELRRIFLRDYRYAVVAEDASCKWSFSVLLKEI